MKPIIISAINLRSGGTLSILQDCLGFLQENKLHEYHVIALVHDKSLLNNVEGIEFIEFPKSTRSYFYRLYYEYIYFKKLSKQLKPYLWFSLHDMTPNVTADIRAVYCHNPSPFFKLNLKQALVDPTFVLFNLFYKYVYRINIRKNDFVIVQQDWLRVIFKKLYSVTSVIVAYPDSKAVIAISKREPKEMCTFFFPTLPRFFKNIEIIVDAVTILNQQAGGKFGVIVTIDGCENKYARYIEKYSDGVENINFIGRVTREKVFALYEQSDCLVFPSKLETWGLPITEFKSFGKPMLVADLPYAHETVGDYEQVDFFDPDNPQELADLMKKVMCGQRRFVGNKAIKVAQPFSQNWSELFDLLLKKKRGMLKFHSSLN